VFGPALMLLVTVRVVTARAVAADTRRQKATERTSGRGLMERQATMDRWELTSAIFLDHPGSSQIEHEVAPRPCAAAQRAAADRRPQGTGAVRDGARHDRRLAVVADAGAARPSDGNVARLRELEQVGVLAAPADGEIAARELDRRAVARTSRR